MPAIRLSPRPHCQSLRFECSANLCRVIGGVLLEWQREQGRQQLVDDLLLPWDPSSGEQLETIDGGGREKTPGRWSEPERWTLKVCIISSTHDTTFVLRPALCIPLCCGLQKILVGASRCGRDVADCQRAVACASQADAAPASGRPGDRQRRASGTLGARKCGSRRRGGPWRSAHAA